MLFNNFAYIRICMLSNFMQIIFLPSSFASCFVWWKLFSLSRISFGKSCFANIGKSPLAFLFFPRKWKKRSQKQEFHASFSLLPLGSKNFGLQQTSFEHQQKKISNGRRRYFQWDDRLWNYKTPDVDEYLTKLITHLPEWQAWNVWREVCLKRGNVIIC